MVQAYVLIQTEVGKAAVVAEEVREIQGVEAADDRRDLSEGLVDRQVAVVAHRCRLLADQARLRVSNVRPL